MRKILAVISLMLLVLTACAKPTVRATPTSVPPSPTPEAAVRATPTSGSTSPTPTVADLTQVDESGRTDVDQDALKSELDTIPTAAEGLSDVEVEGILYMREEEKLAHDVYTYLYDKWNLPIFSNIASSEQTHMDSVKALIDRYGLQDPVAGNGAGEFTNPQLQELYNSLIETGSRSVVDALRVGAAIEEIDIIDLEKHLSETDRADIKLVYENLMKGSRNHLRAFVSNLKKEGVDYAPQYLDQATYDAIVGSDVERGRRGGN